MTSTYRIGQFAPSPDEIERLCLSSKRAPRRNDTPSNAKALDCPADASFEISLRPFGIVRRAAGRLLRDREFIGRGCFTLHGREAPCERCPVRELSSKTHASAVVPGSNGELWVETAERSGKNTACVAAWSVSPELLSELVTAHIEREAERAGLTRREREVLRLAIAGRTPTDVAGALRISVSTAKFHISNILAKLGAESRIDLLRMLL